MTLRELSQLHYLKKLIERLEKRIAEASAYGVSGMNYDGMPHASDPKSPTEAQAERKLKLEEELKSLNEEYDRIKDELEASLNTVGDYRIRCILTYRFVDLMDWNGVADELGGKNSAESVKKACYDFLKKSQNSSRKSHISQNDVL